MGGMWQGVALAALAGLATGSCLWPIKIIRRLRFEHFWFVGMLPLALLPWLVVLLTIPNPWAGFREVGWRPLLIANTLAIGWGVANILGGRCAVRIGLALTGAIVTGLGVTVAVVTPMILKGTGLFGDSPDLLSAPGLTVLGAIVLMLCAVVFSAIAGFGRERVLKEAQSSSTGATGGFLVGLLMAIAAGVLSSGPALAFVYGNGPIIVAMKAQGAGDVSASLSVWAGGLFAGAILNIAYPALLITKNRSWSMLHQNLGESLLASLIGAQLIVGFGLQGLGMNALGTLGASIGTGIQQALQIVGMQAVGFISGEWRSVFGRPRQLIVAAVAILLVAVAIMSVANFVS
jgi:L-rhamnose-H+ transport protein